MIELNIKGRTAILLSGGPNSAYAALCAARTVVGPLIGIFANYKQPDGHAQEESVLYVATRLGLECLTLRMEFPNPSDPEGLHESLIRVLSENGVSSIWMGLRHILPIFDKRGDSNFVWAARMGALYKVNIMSPVSAASSFIRTRELYRANIFPARLH